jgi:hypothetical protein
MAVILGVDCGLFGGIAFTETIHKSDLFTMPIVNKSVDVEMFMNMLVNYKPDICIIEKPQMRSANKGLLTSASNYGRLLALLELRNIETTPVHPFTWGNVVFPNIKGTKNRKQAAIDLCQQNGITIPHITKNKLSDGAAEAYCISLYGLWKLTQQ